MKWAYEVIFPDQSFLVHYFQWMLTEMFDWTSIQQSTRAKHLQWIHLMTHKSNYTRIDVYCTCMYVFASACVYVYEITSITWYELYFDHLNRQLLLHFLSFVNYILILFASSVVLYFIHWNCSCSSSPITHQHHCQHTHTRTPYFIFVGGLINCGTLWSV